MYALDIQTKELIADTLMTQDNAYKFIEELSTAHSMLYKANIDSTLINSLSEQMKYTDLLNKLFINIAEKNPQADTIADFVDEIHNWLKEIEPIRFKIAFKPRVAFIKNLHRWVKSNINSITLLDFEVDGDILGGAIISVNGKYYDYSLEKMLSQYFTSNKDAVISILQK